MKKFLIKISSFLILIILFFTGMTILIPHNKVNYDYAYYNKLQRLDTLSSPRLVIVGGSNTVYCFDSKKIQDSIGMNVHNMGIQAAVGLRFMVDRVSSKLNKGDKLIIMPEYQHFYTWYNGQNVALTDVVIYSGYDSWKLLNPSQLLLCISEIPKYIKFSLIIKPTKEWTPRASTFNNWGDEQGHWVLPSRFKQDQLGLIKDEFFDYSVEDLKEKVDKLREKGVEVYFFWPNVIKSNYELNKNVVEEIRYKFNEHGLHFSTTSDWFVQDDSVAFDSPYHFIYSGVEEATKRFIEAVRAN